MWFQIARSSRITRFAMCGLLMFAACTANDSASRTNTVPPNVLHPVIYKT